MYDDYERLLTKVASAYYVDDIPQNVIAAQLGLSKSKICRMLAEAKSRGMVRTQIVGNHPHSELERRFEHRWGLREIIIVPTSKSIMEDVGRAGAEYLNRVVRDGDIIGVSWGRTLLELTQRMSPLGEKNVSVVQLVGGLDTQMNQLQSSKLALQLAMAGGCNAELLYCPAKAPNAEVHESLTLDPLVNRVMQIGRKASIALVGIGAVTPTGDLFKDGYIPYDTLQQLEDNGAVGDICMRFYDESGKEVRVDTSDLIMSIPLDSLREIPNVVCLACGKEKASAILGALRGGIANTRITDDQTAKAIIELDRKDMREKNTA